MASSEPPKGVHWLVWALVTLAAAGITTYGVIKASENSKPGSQPLSSSDLVAAHKADLISAIQLESQAQIKAKYNLDASLLSGTSTGALLKLNIDEIQEYQNRGLYVDSRLLDQQFRSFKVSLDGKRAEVSLDETWSSVVYAIQTRECSYQIPPHLVPQTVYLIHNDNGWIANAISYDRREKTAAQECS